MSGAKYRPYSAINIPGKHTGGMPDTSPQDRVKPRFTIPLHA